MIKKDISNTFILNALEIPSFSCMSEVSRLLSLSPRLIYSLSKYTEHYYKSFDIRKHNGTYRKISAPSYSMRIVQKWILRNILDNVQPSHVAMAFRRGNTYGCKANANFHKYPLFTVCLDLHNFFSTVSNKQIFQLFKDIGYNNFSSSLLANICTLDGVLPQGGICSPSLSNLVCRKLDARLVGLCNKRGIIYTRYADDMCFSCDDKELLKKTIYIAQKIIENENLEINHMKTKFINPRNRKMITGIVVTPGIELTSPKLKAPREMKLEVRASIHQSIITGDYKSKNRILGLISYIDYIEMIPSNDEQPYKEKIKIYIKKCTKKIEVYKELVDAYNQNLFFSDLPKIEYTDPESSFDCYLDPLYFYSEIEERERYFSKIGKVDTSALPFSEAITDTPTPDDLDTSPF